MDKNKTIVLVGADEDAEAFCATCGEYLEEDFKECPYCGTELNWEVFYE